MFPNFLVIGAAKCGTTSLCKLLGEHPDVFVSDPKEPHYFSSEIENPSRQSAYEELFRGAKGKGAVGEGSVSYSLPKVIERAAMNIHRFIPMCKLIYMVRHPISRIESDWRMRRHERRTPKSINEAVRKQENLLEIGMYWKNLSVYRSLFPDDQILILFLEDFSRNPHHELERCYEHISVSTSFRPNNAFRPRNASNSFRQYSRLASYIRGLRGFRRFEYCMPRIVKKLGKTFLTKKEQFYVQWDEDVLADVKIKFIEDSKKFLKYCGKPINFWNL